MVENLTVMKTFCAVSILSHSKNRNQTTITCQVHGAARGAGGRRIKHERTVSSGDNATHSRIADDASGRKRERKEL